MREVGQEFYVAWNNQYYGEKCKITKINEKKGYTDYNIELLKKQDSWIRSEEGEKVTLHFSDVNYCDLKENPLPKRN